MSDAPFVPAAGSLPTREPAAGRAPEATTPPQLAAGVCSHGPMQGSGSVVAPHLVRRGDGQVVQVTPLLAAVVEAIDGERDLDEIASEAGRRVGRPLHPDDVGLLIDQKLRPLGLVRGPDGTEPSVRRTDPLLGLRGRVRVVGAERTNRIVGPFLWLFRPAVVAAVMVAFVAVSAWAVLEHGMTGPIEDAMAQPALLLALIALIVVSAAFHEVGHAAACRYGGATPGVMGAAVYLVWPAFYTDVTDSYRLDRRSRLRVDLGGLYFNAVFTVGAVAAYAITGAEALLVLVPVQLLQMVRQLVPLVRFDGYHILADLVGVPDLFSRIRPTLQRALPWKRTTAPNPLQPWAQRVVVGWVAVVVPVLLVSFALLLVNLPTLLVSSVRSLRLQSELLGTNLDEGRLAATALGVVAMATVAFVPLSTLYLGGRIFHRGSRTFWRATEGRPLPRAAVATLAIALVVAAGPGLLPTPPTDDAGAEFAAPLAGGPGTELALAGRAAPPSEGERGRTFSAPAEAVPLGDRTAAGPTGDTSRPTAPTPDRTVSEDRGPAPAPRTTEAPDTVDTWPFSFPPPAPPGPDDNQVLVTNVADGAAAFAHSASLEWDADGVVDNVNSAWALAACTDCRTVASAFQIVASTAPADTVVPQNIAAAANEECDRCATAAVAVQLVVTLDGMPDADARAEVEALVAEVQSRAGAYATASPADIRTELRAAKAEALEILAPWVDAVEDDTDETVEPTDPEGTPEAADPTTQDENDPGTVGDGTTGGTDLDDGSPDDEAAPGEGEPTVPSDQTSDTTVESTPPPDDESQPESSTAPSDTTDSSGTSEPSATTGAADQTST